MKLISSKRKSKFVNIMLYGKHGSGKTPLSVTAPNPIIIDLDDGLLSVADQDIPTLEVRNFSDLEEAYDFCKGKKGKKFDTIILDGGHELVDVVLEALKADPETKDKRQAYMAVAEVTKFWIRRFRDLKKHFVFTSIAEIIEIGETEKYRVYFAGNVLKKEVPGMFNEIFCLHYSDEEEEEKKVLQCRECPDYDARDRSNTLKKFEKKDLTYIINKIQKGKRQNGKK